jgi:SAM-dependent methyltransferase
MRDDLSLHSSCCPLTGIQGVRLRQREPRELFEAYRTYYGAPLPEAFFSRYFNDSVDEFYNPNSGFRWYTPAQLGDGDYYAWLAKTFTWYYNPEGWDKLTALSWITSELSQPVLEVGCGNGQFLGLAKKCGIDAIGIEINDEAIRDARSRGLNVFRASDLEPADRNIGILCMFQVIEHVVNPKGFLGEYIRKYHPHYIVLSAPCSESLLAHTSDPLSWPPHHATAWSSTAFECLAGNLGYRINKIAYQPLTYKELESRIAWEGSRKLFQMPYIPRGVAGYIVFRVGRIARANWATRAHSILVLLEARQAPLRDSGGY